MLSLFSKKSLRSLINDEVRLPRDLRKAADGGSPVDLISLLLCRRKDIAASLILWNDEFDDRHDGAIVCAAMESNMATKESPYSPGCSFESDVPVCVLDISSRCSEKTGYVESRRFPGTK